MLYGGEVWKNQKQ